MRRRRHSGDELLPEERLGPRGGDADRGGGQPLVRSHEGGVILDHPGDHLRVDGGGAQPRLRVPDRRGLARVPPRGCECQGRGGGRGVDYRRGVGADRVADPRPLRSGKGG